MIAFQKTVMDFTDKKTYSAVGAFGSKTLMLIGTGDPAGVTVTKAGVVSPLQRLSC